MMPMRFVTVQPCSRMSLIHPLPLKRSRTTARPPASKVPYSCMSSPLAWKSGIVT